jgi:hypothetical protein
MYECGAQVSDPHIPGSRKKDVFRLEIAVHDAHVVKSIETECLRKIGPKNTELRYRCRNTKTHDLSCPPS